jgi:hypothetical protein
VWRQGVSDTIKQLQAGKGNAQYPLDAAFIATSDVRFVADEASVMFLGFMFLGDNVLGVLKLITCAHMYLQ